MQNILLVIDPFLKQPADDAINVISKLHSDMQREGNYFDSYVEVFFPSHSDKTLKGYFEKLKKKNKEVIGVISLGSYANVTENLEWVRVFGEDLKECVIEKDIPFLGICFSHQLFAWIYGANVDFVPNKETLPEKKYNEFRKIEILHPRLKDILGNTTTFISKAKHEQEVKNVPEKLELICTSEHCKIEGLVHKNFPAFSIQTHPEEFHESGDGWNFIKKFISYFILKSNIGID